jgi:hypothetical protein
MTWFFPCSPLDESFLTTPRGTIATTVLVGATALGGVAELDGATALVGATALGGVAELDGATVFVGAAATTEIE